MSVQAIAIDGAYKLLVWGAKQALTKEGIKTCLDLLAKHVHGTENKVDDEILRVFGPVVSKVLVSAKEGLTAGQYEDLVFGALQEAAAQTPATWDDVLVNAAYAAAKAVR